MISPRTVHIYIQTIHRTQLTTSVGSFVGFEPRMVKLKLTLTPSGSSTVHIYIQTIHRTQLTTSVGSFLGFKPRMVVLKVNDRLIMEKFSCLTWEECELYPAFA
jgi:uncharacterized integral membrane protein